MRLCVSLAVGFGDRMIFVGGKNVPEIFEVRSLAPLNESLWILTVESKMPDAWRVVDRFPSGYAGEKRVLADIFQNFVPGFSYYSMKKWIEYLVIPLGRHLYYW